MGDESKITQHDLDQSMEMVTNRLDGHGADLRDIRSEVRDIRAEIKDSAKVNRENFAIVFKELKAITAKVHHVELQGVKADGNIKVGMAKMSGEMKAKIVGIGAGSGTAMFGIIEALKALVNYFQTKGHA